ncbi:PIN domain-containing protein [Pseudoflavonifractor sp. An85]|uniref:PIN domain-containing protein n=1 Tax=Pseudoflavonifractor sp. An85 TaxID=1965661 RepID=UPI000B3927C8|nr:PIN domain-containing protein [Pseudoflavonifractor sp. An85]OUN20020.1 hypothetical protein B5G37_13025 [Pseudoflavonifractor sp. An85]
MVFFDTCIWIELCCTMVPSNPTQQAQAQKASQLLANVQQQNEQIVTCNEQLIEVISAIQKVKMREYNKISKPGVGNLKEYRNTSDFASAKALCAQAVADISHLSTKCELQPYQINDVLARLHLVDMNDYLYYQHCIAQKIDFYTFDGDFANLDAAPQIHIL